MRSLPGWSLPLLMILATSCTQDPFHQGQPSVRVDGSVFLRDGPPLAGVLVDFHYVTSTQRASTPMAPATPPPITWAVTDSEGAVHIWLREGQWQVWVGGRDETVIMSQHIADTSVRLPGTTLDLHYNGYRVTGHVIGPGHVPMDDAFMRLSVRATNTIDIPVRSTGYSLVVPPDTVTIWTYPGIEDGYPHVRSQIVASSDTTIDLSLDGNLVSGHATGVSGIPLYGGWVEADNANASANSTIAVDGSYSMYLPTGEYVFTLYTGGRGDGTHVYPPMLIDSPRTLDFTPPAP